MVGRSYAFNESSNGIPVYLIEEEDVTAAGTLYDRLRENITGLNLSFYSDLCANSKIVVSWREQPLPDGQALQARLLAVSNDKRHAYVASLNGQHLAVLVDHAQRSALRGGPASSYDNGRSPHPRAMGIMETETDKVMSITIAEDAYPVQDKHKICGWQWKRDFTLSPARMPPLQMQGILTRRLERFVRHAATAPAVA